MALKVALVMGSDSDLPVVQKAAEVLDKFGVSYEMHIMSAHRTPEEATAFARGARASGFGVLVGFAGMAAHLSGVLAACTTLPVVGVPCKGGALDGLDALLATVQMPAGVPVATVALGGGANAALLAVQILALQDEELVQKLEDEKLAMRHAVQKKNEALHNKIYN